MLLAGGHAAADVPTQWLHDDLLSSSASRQYANVWHGEWQPR